MPAVPSCLLDPVWDQFRTGASRAWWCGSGCSPPKPSRRRAAALQTERARPADSSTEVGKRRTVSSSPASNPSADTTISPITGPKKAHRSSVAFSSTSRSTRRRSAVSLLRRTRASRSSRSTRAVVPAEFRRSRPPSHPGLARVPVRAASSRWISARTCLPGSSGERMPASPRGRPSGSPRPQASGRRPWAAPHPGEPEPFDRSRSSAHSRTSSRSAPKNVDRVLCVSRSVGSTWGGVRGVKWLRTGCGRPRSR